MVHQTLLHTKYLSFVPNSFIEEYLLRCSLYLSMGAIDRWSWSMTSLDPGGLIGRIYVGDHYTLLHTY